MTPSRTSPASGDNADSRTRRGGRPTRAQATELDRTLRRAALQLFLDQGYDGTSMDAIARAAGTTKASLYTRFPSKEAMFRSVLEWAVQRADRPAPAYTASGDLTTALTEIATAAWDRAVHPDLIKLRRIAAAQAERHPDLARQATAWPSPNPVAELLRHHARTGTIVADDPDLLADHFLAMVTAPAWSTVFGHPRPGAADAERTIGSAVALFVRGLRSFAVPASAAASARVGTPVQAAASAQAAESVQLGTSVQAGASAQLATPAQAGASAQLATPGAASAETYSAPAASTAAASTAADAVSPAAASAFTVATADSLSENPTQPAAVPPPSASAGASTLSPAGTTGNGSGHSTSAGTAQPPTGTVGTAADQAASLRATTGAPAQSLPPDIDPMPRRRNGSGEPSARDQLLNATAQVMVTEGYAAATSRRVAAVAGVKPALVHYYFPTMDDLFLAVFRRGAQRHLDRERHALDAGRARSMWDLHNTNRDTALVLEFMALANHRKEIRSEVALYTEISRENQRTALGRLLPHGLRPATMSPPVLGFILAAVTRLLVSEQMLGITAGHSDTITYFTALLADPLRRSPA
ncbi:TetR/AcrR family transcriptional regulator [Nocardia sp. BMG111209]|uniref:TetR/AcrR family transcriptional regulator n=1 Tax=Nocardia sp. BMG111209 TaxID=1160137 RepID=UPI000373070F|nr:TetR/AcrR family transcriptional regulator [Nocardia sp. BMG111209]